MTLTEQWKKGELKLGECYFIRLKSGKIIPQMYSFVCIDGKHHCTDFGLSYGNVEEVLAPVPSYEKWQKMKEQRDACAWALDKIGDVLVQHNLVKK